MLDKSLTKNRKENAVKATILYLNEEKPFTEYSQLLPLISQERQERIARMAVNGDKIRSLFAELLIRYEASEQLGTDFNLLEFGQNEFGKPFIVGKSGYDFSVSHSARAVAFAGASSRVGVDIERIRLRKSGFSERFFAENEIKFIEESENPDEAFFEIWTKKEAYSKMLGKGLAAGFGSFDVTGNGLGCEFFTKITNGYAFSVCEEKISALPETEELSEEDFLQKLAERLNFTLY